MIEEKEILNKINFLKNCTYIEQDFSGHSSALRFICKVKEQKYFIKIYENNELLNLEYIDNIYQELNIPTAKIIEKEYLKSFNKTYAVYEYIDGKTLLELSKELEIKELEKIGFSVGKHLSKFRNLKGNKSQLKKYYESEFSKLIENLFYMEFYYEKQEHKKLANIDLNKLCKIFNKYKKRIYKIEPSFIHKDINLNNVIIKNYEPFFIDTSGGMFSFRNLDFRGICWWTWDGENKIQEQAIYRGIFKGYFNNDIPDGFHSEIAFTIIYEFLLKVSETRKSGDMKRLEYIFSKFKDIFNKTNYFENYRFEWFN